jgi:serine/threonine-protein kinase
MPSTASELLAALGHYHLIESAPLEDLTRRLEGRTIEPRVLAQQLIGQGWLTPFQANYLLQGRGHELLLGSYVLLERLGEGGMGAVYKARHVTLDRTVALKLIRKERLDNAVAVRRFRREIRAAAQVEHPHIVRAFDADEVDGRHLLVMEYVEGIDLAQLVKKQGPLPVRAACDYVRQAALGLQHAFEKGLIHRDIKPHNLLLQTSRHRPGAEGALPDGGGSQLGTVKILDLGLARLLDPPAAEGSSSSLTQQGMVMGSLDYLSPEQAQDAHTADIRSDLYSLGCTFYYLLAARVPFPGVDATAKLLKHRQDEPEPVEQVRPEVPPAVAAVVRRLMAKKPGDRYATPVEAALAIAAAAEDRTRAALIESAPVQPFTVLATSDTVEDVNTPDRQAVRRRWWLLNAAGGLLLIVLLGVFAFLLTRSETPQSSPQAAPSEVKVTSKPPDVVPADDWRPLFNGKDLAGWKTSTYNPDEITDDYSVAMEDGEPAIRSPGTGRRNLFFDEELNQFHLCCEFKFAKANKVKPRILLQFHTASPDRGSCRLQVWSEGQAYKIFTAGSYLMDEGAWAGDHFEVRTRAITELPTTVDPRKPVGQWNRVDFVSLGDRALFVLNGTVIGGVANLRETLADGKEVPVTHGKFKLGTSKGDMFFRHIRVRSIKTMPVEFLK